MYIHIFGMEGFQAADSYATVIIVVPNPQSLYEAFAARLRAHYGKLPLDGIPRILRPRKKFGTVHGFTIVDPGGNWLRFFKLGDTASEEKAEGLPGILNVATRLGDARGDEQGALKTLANGLERFADAPALERARAYFYQAELAVRTKNRELALSSLRDADALELTDDQRAALADEREYVRKIVEQ